MVVTAGKVSAQALHPQINTLVLSAAVSRHIEENIFPSLFIASASV